MFHRSIATAEYSQQQPGTPPPPLDPIFIIFFYGTPPPLDLKIFVFTCQIWFHDVGWIPLLRVWKTDPKHLRKE